MDLTTWSGGDWLVVACVLFVLVFAGLRLLKLPAELVTTTHAIEADIHDHRAPSHVLVPAYQCRACHAYIREVTLEFPTRLWVSPLLRCPSCEEILPVIDWVDDTHVEILS